MPYIQIITDNKKELFSKLKEEILNDYLLASKVDRDKLSKLLDVQEEMLIRYLEDFNINKFNDDEIKVFYKDFNVNFEVIYRSLNAMRDNILFLLKKEDLSLVEIYNFDNYFQHLIDLIAKAYIKKTSKLLLESQKNIFRDKILLKVHDEWVKKIVLALQKDELQYFPLTTIKDCKFNKYLYYPESLMICLDKRLCVYLEDMHKVIHRLADTLYLHLKNKEFSEGYFVLKDLISQMQKFVETIADMYYITSSNPEKSFLKFLELIGFEKQVYISMITFTNYKVLLKKYSEEEVLKAFNQIFEKLQKKIDQSNTIMIKGFNYNIFILNMNIPENVYENFIESLKGNFSAKIDSKTIEFKPLIIGFEVDMYKHIKAFEIIEVLDTLKKRAIKEKKEILTLTNEEKEDINQLISDKYDGNFILNAFNEGDVEIVAQPIFDENRQNIFALEILGRVKHLKKLVPMQDLISKIEEMGLVKTLDLLVGVKLNESKELISKISKTIFINVDFDTVLNRSYLKNLETIQSNMGFKIILEIDKIDFLSQYKILENINNEYNLTFAIDNFEVQCISLKQFIYLVENNIVTYLKVGRRAFNNTVNADYVLDILKFIQDKLGIEIIVKHIDNEKVLKKTKEYGFKYIQGYLLEMPKILEDIIIGEVK